MITFKLNGKEVQGEEGQYILQVAQKYGVDIPTLCYHKALEPAGMCRLCTVELFDGRRTRFVTACNYPIWEGMEVNTDTEAVHEGRRLIVELLLARCPDVPLLQDLGKEKAAVPGQDTDQANRDAPRDRKRGGVPGLRRSQLHDRRDCGRQRRYDDALAIDDLRLTI